MYTYLLFSFVCSMMGNGHEWRMFSKCEAAFDSDLILSHVFWETPLSKALPCMKCKALLQGGFFFLSIWKHLLLVEKIDSLHKFEGTLLLDCMQTFHHLKGCYYAHESLDSLLLWPTRSPCSNADLDSWGPCIPKLMATCHLNLS